MQAVILAAGMGRRLGALTENQTKCMVKLHGLTLIERSLDALTDAGIARIVLVVGYRAEGVRQLIGDSYADVPVTYVDNPDYETTNNIFSLYLAKHELEKDDTLLLESDLIYEPKILRDLLANPAPNVAVVDRHRSWMDGTVVTISDDNVIQQFITKNNIDHAAHHRYYKTVNIYKFSREYLSGNYLPFLEAYVHSVGSDEYYEQVLRVITMLDKQDLAAMPLAGEKWYEIDDPQDYQIAQTLFAPPELQYSEYLNRHGGYWRFPELRDFCYVVNPYFPPAEMVEEMRRFLEPLLRGYPSAATVQDLLAAKLFNLTASAITVGNGAAELICALGQEIKAARIGVSVPTFEEYLKRFPGAEMVEYSSSDEEFKPNLSQLKSVTAETDALVLVNPENPSGQCLSTADLLELARHMEQERKHLILDESFVDFAEPEHCTSLLRHDVLEAHPHLVIVKSISKSYGVPGTRLGVLATADAELLARIRSHTPVWNVNSFGEFFLQIIGVYQADYETACRQMRAERSRFYKLLGVVPNIHVIPSHANYLLCEPGGTISATDLAERMLRDHAILVKDCSNKVGMTNRQFLRVAVKDTADNDYFLAALSRIMADL
jgi:histidinol-phosphate/aromatic aminotransferase/cobyric acid decarboxylase-like protein/CTP:phosphocholine cytidylyltransferase-like protein